MSYIHRAAKPPDFKPFEEQPEGLPRPQYRTNPDMHHYNSDNHRDPINGEANVGDRRLYQKIPVPWNTYEVSDNVPQFNTDFVGSGILDIRSIANNPKETNKKEKICEILKDSSESYANKKCPMCGGKFEDDDPAVCYTGSTIKEILSDWLPYHPHCMDLVIKHCPHLRRDSKPSDPDDFQYKHGTYGEIIDGAIHGYVSNVALQPVPWMDKNDD